MKDCSQYNLPCRLVRLIPFVDLPIKVKFRLFSIGVLFWFMVMAALTVVGMVGINVRYDKIVNHAVPQDMRRSRFPTVRAIKPSALASVNAKAEGRNKAVRFEGEMWKGDEF